MNKMRKRRAYTISISSIEEYYTITEDGRVWSKIKNRWLRPVMNDYGYVFYSISKGMGEDRVVGAFAHTLVALKYIGSPPSEKHEIDHIDGNKRNNHYSNLRWVTKSENISNSFKSGRRGYWLGREKPAHEFTTECREKMANAKKKPVVFVIDGIETIFPSIDDAAVGLSTYRKKIYNCIKENKSFGGGILKFKEDSFENPPDLWVFKNTI